MTPLTSAPRARLVAVGDELLLGDQLNGNGAVLGRELAAIGVRVIGHTVVGDDIDAIASALFGAAVDTEVVVVCGGLGPTQDDLTREGLALAAGVSLVRDASLEAQLRERFEVFARDRGTTVPELNWRQADVPAGAVALPNEVGTAPGLLLMLRQVPIYVLPGVPREFSAMLTASVLPDLETRYPQRPRVVRQIVRTVGLWESAVAEAMAPEVARTAGTPAISFLASGGETEVVVTAVAESLEAARELVDPTVAFARAALGDAVYSEPSLEADVVRLLSKAGATLACAESLTAGLLCARIANVPGASAVLRGGMVVYTTDLKSTLLDISRLKLFAWQAVSAETAAAMAAGIVEKCGSDYGVALTGVAGPSSQDGYAPGAVFVSVSGPAGVATRQLALPGDRAQVRALAVTSALAMLRAAIRQDLRR